MTDTKATFNYIIDNDLHLLLSPAKPTSDDPANLLRTQLIRIRPQHVRMTRDLTVV